MNISACLFGAWVKLRPGGSTNTAGKAGNLLRLFGAGIISGEMLKNSSSEGGFDNV